MNIDDTNRIKHALLHELDAFERETGFTVYTIYTEHDTNDHIKGLNLTFKPIEESDAH